MADIATKGGAPMEVDASAPISTYDGKQFSLEILHMIRDAQQKNGLRHRDYQRYHAYCSRRLRKIRRSLEFTHRGGKNHSFVRKEVSIEAIEKRPDGRFLQLLLVSAERAWAYAMELKEDGAKHEEQSTERRRKRFHALRRFHKAATFATQLEKLCLSTPQLVDVRTKWETQAYAAFMRGTFAFEHHRWNDCKVELSAAATIYERLASSLSGDTKAMFQSRVDDVTPMLRYCAYKSGDDAAVEDLMQRWVQSLGGDGEEGGGGGGDDIFSDMIDQIRQQQSATLSEVTWLGRAVPVKSANVRQFLVGLKDAEKRLDEMAAAEVLAEDDKRIEAIEQRLSLLDALVKQAIGAQNAMRDEQRGNANFRQMLDALQQQSGGATEKEKTFNVSDDVHLYSYLLYVRCIKSMQRNELMIDAAKVKHRRHSPYQHHLAATTGDVTADEVGRSGRVGVALNPSTRAKPWQEMVRLFDLLLQTDAEIQSLPSVEPQTDVYRDVDIHCHVHRAARTFFLGRYYGALEKFDKAAALYSLCARRVAELDRISTDTVGSSVAAVRAKESVAELNKMLQIDGDECRAANLVVASSSTVTDGRGGAAGAKVDDSAVAEVPLSERLDRWLMAPVKHVSSSSVAMATDANGGGGRDGQTTLCRLPPDFQPIAAKPVFFDVAFNSFDRPPTLNECLGGDATSGGAGAGSDTGAAGSGGLLSNVSGWLWGRKK